jgi:hypothetical protein
MALAALVCILALADNDNVFSIAICSSIQTSNFHSAACAFLPLYKIFKYPPALAWLSLAATNSCLTR